MKLKLQQALLSLWKKALKLLLEAICFGPLLLLLSRLLAGLLLLLPLRCCAAATAAKKVASGD